MWWSAALVLVLASCYDVPRPVCGFRCGPAAACPSDYACADDGYCHVAGSSPALTCPLVDAGIDAFDFWPFIQTLAPEDNATGVAIETTVLVKFTEQVLGVSATSFTLIAEDDTLPVAAHVSYDLMSRTATLAPDAPLASSKRYIAALGDAIVDARGNPIFGKRTWSFKTARDMASPVVTMIEPTPGTTEVPIDSIIVVTFSEPVQYPNGGIGISPSSSFALGYFSQTALKLTPQPVMLPNTTYTVTVTDAITDLTGNPLANAPAISSFTTGPDTIPPTVTLLNPPADDTDLRLPIIISASFSEPVNGVSSSTFTLHDGATELPATVQYTIVNPGSRARLTPIAPLAAGTTYTARLTVGITDDAGNALAPVTWSFATAP